MIATNYEKKLTTMSSGCILEAAKTMAFGGVATGNMKAYEQVTAAGIISESGFTSMISACIRTKDSQLRLSENRYFIFYVPF